MKRLTNWTVIVIAFSFVCGCTGANPVGQGSAQSTSSLYVHPFTRFSFPESVGSFRRVEIDKYDQEGRDVGVGYNASIPIAATVFVYPGPKDFALVPAPKQEGVSDSLLVRHFEQCKQDIFRAHPDAKLLGESNFTLVQGKNEFYGKRAVFSLKYNFGLLARESTSELYVFLMEPGLKFLLTDRYFVMYRITYPSGKGAEAEPQVSELMTNLSWPVK